MLNNRSMPPCTVIPELGYPDVDQATAWLCEVFGFNLRVRIESHRAQLAVGDGAVVLTRHELPPSERGPAFAHAVMVRVDDVVRHHERARQRGARIVRPLADYPYGERQYTAADLVGRCWTFTQSVADVAPEEWGGTSHHA